MRTDPGPSRLRSAVARLATIGGRVGLGRILALALLPGLLALRIADPFPVEALRLNVFDAFQRLKPRAPPPERPVVIVDIDEASLQAFGQWPWPRTRLADLVRRLREAGAVVVAFDIVFAESDRLSPPGLADSLPEIGERTRADLRAQPSSDAVFAEALAGIPVILGQAAADRPIPWPASEPPPRTGIAVVGEGADPARALVAFPGLVRNLPALEAAAAGRGVFSIVAEQDGVVRRVPLVVRAGDAMVPSLGIEIVRVLAGAESILVQTGPGGVEGVRLADVRVPTDPEGRAFLRFRPHDPGLSVSARDVLSGDAGTRVRDRIVLVGTSALGLLDNRTTPLERSMPGVEIQAQLVETMLGGEVLAVPPDAVLAELAAATAVSLALVVLAPAIGPLGLLLVGALTAAALVAIAWLRFSLAGLLFDATFPLAASFAVFLTIVFANYAREQSARTRIRAAFGRYLSPDLVEQLALSPETLRLGGEERRLTIMFADVRGFTRIAEFYKPDPGGLTRLMNRFLTPLTDAILERRGTIDKYMGDAIMAFWNAPLADPDQERNAMAAALDMLARMDALNALRRTEALSGGHPVLPLDVGIGINTGTCVVGNMGSERRFDYSVLGDAVNLASRLEGQSSFYGVKVILGAATAEAVSGHYPVLEIDRVRVKGKSEPESIWTLLGPPPLLASPRFAALAERHAAMLATYRARQWEETVAAAAACAPLAEGLPLARLYDLYRERATALAADPPGPNWDGVRDALSK